MAIVKFVDAINEVRGAIDSVKEGQARRARLVCRWRPQGPQSYAPDGSKLHELFFMRFHEGPWSDGATRNREMIKAAQRMAHDIERVCYHPEEYGEEDREQAQIWQQKYTEYRSTIPRDSKCYKHFYGWMYSEIYRGIRKDNECRTHNRMTEISPE